MAELFLNLTDNVMKFVSVRQHSDLSQQIRDALLQCLSLVRESIAIDCEGDSSERVCTDLVSSQAQDPSHHMAVPLTAHFEQTAMISNFHSPLLRDENNPGNSESLGTISKPVLGGCLGTEYFFSPEASNASGPGQINEFSQPYFPLYSIQLHSKFPRRSVSVELVRSTLNFAYHVLHNAVDLSTGLVAQMFGSSLQLHSREQLLSKLLWALGPGSSALEEFANIDITTGFQEPEKSETSKHVQAFNMFTYSGNPSLINAEGVVSWLDSLGVRKIDEDTLEIPAWDQAAPPDSGSLPPEFSQSRYSFLNADVFFSPTRSTIRKGKAELTKSSTVRTTRISQSALFRHLSEASVCISSGLAYYRQHLVKVVIASQVC